MNWFIFNIVFVFDALLLWKKNIKFKDLNTKTEHNIFFLKIPPT